MNWSLTLVAGRDTDPADKLRQGLANFSVRDQTVSILHSASVTATQLSRYSLKADSDNAERINMAVLRSNFIYEHGNLNFESFSPVMRYSSFDFISTV